MAPGKKTAESEGNSKKRVTRNENRRVTRSVTRKQGSNSALLVSAEVPKQQQKKKAATKMKKTKDAAASKEKKPQSEKTEADAADVGKKTEQAKQAADDCGPHKVIFIERCTQCSSFNKAATTVKEGLEAAVPGIRVIINPEKPRRGCLEVREDGGQVFLSLLDMKRPFTPMKNLDMEKVISDIANQIKD